MWWAFGPAESSAAGGRVVLRVGAVAERSWWASVGVRAKGWGEWSRASISSPLVRSEAGPERSSESVRLTFWAPASPSRFRGANHPAARRFRRGRPGWCRPAPGGVASCCYLSEPSTFAPSISRSRVHHRLLSSIRCCSLTGTRTSRRALIADAAITSADEGRSLSGAAGLPRFRGSLSRLFPRPACDTGSLRPGDHSGVAFTCSEAVG